VKTTERRATAVLVNDLVTAMQRALSESADVATHLRRLRNRGYDASVVLEATIGLSRNESDEAATAPRADSRIENAEEASLRLTPLDRKFLRSLKISVEEDES
jgi:hypothetical protein